MCGEWVVGGGGGGGGQGEETKSQRTSEKIRGKWWGRGVGDGVEEEGCVCGRGGGGGG